MAYVNSRPVWIQLLLFVGLAAISFILISFFAVILLAKLTGIPFSTLSDSAKWNGTDDRFVTIIYGMQLAQFVGLFLVPAFIFASLSDPKPNRYLQLKQPWKPSYFLIGMVLMIAAIPFSGLLGELNKHIPFPTSWMQWMQEKETDAEKIQGIILSRHDLQHLFLNFFFIAVLAGVGEELFFRGILQRLLTRWFKSPWAGIILAAIIFSAFHMQFIGFLPRLMLGILLGAIYWYSGSLWAAMLAHFFYDAFVVLMLYLKPDAAKQETLGNGQAAIWAIGLISLAAVVALLAWMKKHSQTRYAEVYANDAKDYTNPFLN